MVKTLYFLMRC